MPAINQTIKINNSYESEPSSGSGSSLSETNEYHTIDDENMNLSYLLKPQLYSGDCNGASESTTTPKPNPIIRVAFNAREETKLPQSIVHGSDGELPHLSSQESPFEGFDEIPTLKKNMSSIAKDKTGVSVPLRENNANQSRRLIYGVPVHSSQESALEGFGSSPFNKLQRRCYSESGGPLNNTEEPGQSGKVLFAKFYDTVLEENSCNAIDGQLPGHQTKDRSVNVNESSSSELSFNGIIKSLTENHKATKNPSAVVTNIAMNLSTSAVMNRSLNTSRLTESFILKKYSNERSPDIFADDDDDDDDNDNDDDNDDPDKVANVVAEHQNQKQEVNPSNGPIDTKTNDGVDSSVPKSLNDPTETSFADDQTLDCGGTPADLSDQQQLFRDNCRREREFLRRTRICLAGVPPPPSVTIPQVDLIDSVLNKKQEIFEFFTKLEPTKSDDQYKRMASLLKPSHSDEEAKTMPWKAVLGVRYHGLSYNLSKASETNDYLSLAVIERFIGAETASSYRNSPSSAKKRNARMKLLTQSPGNRLSHLARRRAIFSSAHLASTSQKSSSSLGPQIVINKKKVKQRRKGTPKRMTPGSKKKVRKTPSLSARKCLFSNSSKLPGPSRETSKRALFQSPAKQVEPRPVVPQRPAITPEIANRVEKSKRALFSPEQKPSSQLESLLLKRKRVAAHDDDDDDADSMGFGSQCSKLFRIGGEILTPRALKIKSQSFCIGGRSSSAASTTTTSALSSSSLSSAVGSCLGAAAGASGVGGHRRNLLGRHSGASLHCSGNSLVDVGKMQRAHSDMVTQSSGLTENQRKKLLWAVSQALQEKKISTKHESFKQYAAVLTRVVRRVFQEFYQRNSTSNSETMLRLAKKYAYHVVSGRTVDDIYLQAKAHIEESKMRQSSSARLSGYIGPEEYRRLMTAEHAKRLSGKAHSESAKNLFTSENSVDSFSLGISQSSLNMSHPIPSTSVTSSGVASMSELTETSFLGLITQDMALTQSGSLAGSQKLSIQANPTLQNSSSKNNLGGVALRENVDGEQRRSAQKNFTGKDQRNVSPYTKVGGVVGAGVGGVRLGSGLKVQSATCFVDLNLPTASAVGAKAKRQIVFDS